MEQIYFNPLQNFAAGRQMGEQQAGQNLLREHGAAAMQGDQNALNALAANPYTMDVAQGHIDRQQRQQNLDRDFGMQQQRLAISQEQLAMTRERARMETEQLAAAGRLAEAELEAEQVKTFFGNLGAAKAAGNQQAYQAIAANGPEEFRGIGWDDYEGAATIAGAAMDGFFEATNKQAEPQSPEGKRALDVRNGFIESGPQVADFDTTSDLRKEFNGIQSVKDFRQQATAYGRVVDSARDPSAAGDLAMIFNFMKVLDPGSVVRESEFATAASASAWLQQMEGANIPVPRPIAAGIRQLASGQRLSQEQRADFLGRSQSLYVGAERQFNSLYDQYTGIAERNNIPVSDALVDYRYRAGEGETLGAPSTATSPTGQIELTGEDRALFEKYAAPTAQPRP